MSVLVQKFGGSSLASVQHIQRAADKIIKAKNAGHRVVVVVSAMGDETDELIALARQIQSLPNPREYDQLLACGEQKSMALLAMALIEKGCSARSLTAAQAGIYTNAVHGHARIIDIDIQCIHRYLTQGEIVVVAGFQGMCAKQITTLGRGGSDLTAVALAAALQANECLIYTDVDGVYFADPRIVPHAKKLEVVSFDEMIELSHLGAKVLHHRAVLLAKKMQVPLRVLSSFEEGEGTQIANADISNAEQNSENNRQNDNVGAVTGIACQEDQALIELSCKNSDGLLAQLAVVLSGFHLSVSSFTVSHQDQTAVVKIVLPESMLGQVKKQLENLLLESLLCFTKYAGLVQLSIVGARVALGGSNAEKFYRILEKHKVKISHTYSSELAIGAVIAVKNSKNIVEELFDVFHLNKNIELV